MSIQRSLRKGKMGAFRDDATTMERWLHPFRAMFTVPTFLAICALAVGAVLCLNRRTVSAVLRVLDWTGTDFCRLHRALSANAWSLQAGSKILLLLLVKAFAKEGTILIGVDETVERRWGPKIADRGIYRDTVRSSADFFVKCSGLRWMVFMLSVPIPWAGGHRLALPFLTLLCPSEKADEKAERKHRATAEKARLGLTLIARWLPGRRIALVGDGAFGCHVLFDRAQKLTKRRGETAGVSVVARIRGDSCLFDPPLKGAKDKRGRDRIVAGRQPKLDERLADPESEWRPVSIPAGKTVVAKKKVDGGEIKKEDVPAGTAPALRDAEMLEGTAVWSSHGFALAIRWILARLPDAGPRTDPWILGCSSASVTGLEAVFLYSARWEVEVAFEDVRRHLGVETQRQWSNLAIRRTTPLLMALRSLVVLWADEIVRTSGSLPVLGAAWYKKQEPTFSDMLAAVRRMLWSSEARTPIVTVARRLMTSRSILACRQSPPGPRPLAERLADLMIWAA